MDMLSPEKVSKQVKSTDKKSGFQGIRNVGRKAYSGSQENDVQRSVLGNCSHS